MKTLKQEVIDAIQAMPEDAELDDIMYRVYVLDKIRQGQQDVREGKVFTSEELKKEIQTW